MLLQILQAAQTLPSPTSGHVLFVRGVPPLPAAQRKALPPLFVKVTPPLPLPCVSGDHFTDGSLALPAATFPCVRGAHPCRILS